ncbi:MAG: response regulator, partial [Pirellulales bacterium]
TVGKAIVDQETGQRGFLITGSEEFLQPYKDGRVEWTAGMRSLRNLNAKAYDLPTMQRNIKQVERLAKQWLSKAALPEIAARRKMNEHPETLQDVANLLQIGKGKRILDGIRADFKQFIVEEELLTAKRFAAVTTMASTTRRTTFILTLVSLVLGGGMTLLITLGITRPIRSLADALRRVTKGDLSHEIQIKSKDEIGDLSKSFNQMLGNLRHLGHEQEKYAEQLTRSNANLEQEATFKDAQAVLAALMGEEMDLQKLGNTVIEFFANHTESQMGAIYVRQLREGEGEDWELYSIGNYAFPQVRPMCNIVAGEELVSQAARSKKTILISDVPEGYVKVTSSLGAALPHHVLVVPFLDGARLKGVIELGSLGAFSDAQIAEIETLVRPVAAAIDAKQGAEKIQSLLKSTQQQATELAKANQELEETSTDLERQKAAIEERNSALEIVRKDVEEKVQELAITSQYKSDFLANMSHEIRTPMTAILGFTDIVRDKVRDPENKEWLDKIQRNGNHLLGIINDILDISKIESNKMSVETIDVSPSQIMTDVISLMSVRTVGRGLSLRIEFDGPIPQTIQSDPTRLRQILVNLTGNAIKFTEVGEVRLVARVLDHDSDEPRMVIDVVDTGMGMTEDQLGNLFQPFVQADTSTTRKFGGTGLGLTISKRLSEMLGGGIAVRSVSGEGSTFSLTVSTGPLNGVKMVDSPAESDATVEVVSDAEGADFRLDCRVLLAEDGPDNQRLISFILKKVGAEITVAENGQIALDRALAARDDHNPYDVILMDMQMPVLDGYTATAKLREAGYTGPIIALTAHAMSSDRKKCIDAGCDDYSTKPINRKQLISLVAKYASQQTPSEVLHVDV